MLNTIVFDLDGTLLPLDMDKFMHTYFNEMGIAFRDMTDPKLLVENIWKATDTMIENLEPRTNEEVFMEAFSKLIDGDLEVYKKRFDKFYDEGFLKVQEAAYSLPLIKDAVTTLKEKGYKIVVATNPMFPRKAIIHRIHWAGFEEKDFSYITCYENNHYCKPQIQFYEEVLKEIDKTPEECMMVGNDVEEDLVAGKLGMQTYLITDNLLHRGSEINCTYKGTYEDFYRFTQELKPVR